MIIKTNKDTGIKRALNLGKLPPKTLEQSFDKDQMVEGQTVYVRELNSIAEYIKFGNTIYKKSYDEFRSVSDGDTNYVPEIINTGFNYSSSPRTEVYIPLNSNSTVETTSTTGNEYSSRLAPYNGRMTRFSWRSENDISGGTYEMKVYYSLDGTEFPGTELFATGSITGPAANTVHTYAGKILKNEFIIPKGCVWTISFNPTVDTDDTNIQVIVEWDYNS